MLNYPLANIASRKEEAMQVSVSQALAAMVGLVAILITTVVLATEGVILA